MKSAEGTGIMKLPFWCVLKAFVSLLCAKNTFTRQSFTTRQIVGIANAEKHPMQANNLSALCGCASNLVARRETLPRIGRERTIREDWIIFLKRIVVDILD